MMIFANLKEKKCANASKYYCFLQLFNRFFPAFCKKRYWCENELILCDSFLKNRFLNDVFLKAILIFLTDVFIDYVIHSYEHYA